MRVQHQRRFVALLGVALVAGVWSAWPLSAQVRAKRPLTYDVYESWKSIGGARLSDDGQWFAYALTSQAEDGVLVVRNVRSGQELKHPRGSGPQFTPDGKFVIFTIAPPKSESTANAAEGGETPPAAGQAGQGGNQAPNRNSVGIMTLPGGQVTTIEQISTFRLPTESSTWVAFHKGRAGGAAGGRGGNRGGGGGRGGAPAAGAGGRGATEPPPAQAAAPPAGQQAAAGGRGAGGQAAAAPQEKRKDPGNDLIIRNLTTGQDVTIPEVTEFLWDDKATWLIYAVSSTDAIKDGVFARQMSDGTVRTLKSGRGHYKSLAIDEAGRQIAFLSDATDYDKPVSPYRLYYWKTSDAETIELVSAATRGMPQGMVVADSAPRFTEDGQRLLLATAPPPPPPPDPNVRRPAPLPVDMWSSKDPIIQPMQKVRATQDQNRNYAAIVHMSDKRFVQLATPDLPTVNPGTDPNRAIGLNGLPYRQEISWDATYNDVYLVDFKTGSRRKVLDHVGGGVSMSPGGKYLLFFDQKTLNWYSQDIASGVRVNLTERLPVKFYDEGHDTPNPPNGLGSPGWTEGDKSVLLYDQFDVWEIRPDGTNARMITGGEGRKQKLVFRYRAPLDAEPAAGGGPGGGGRGGGAGGTVGPISTTKPMLLTTTNDETKASGLFRVPFTGGAPEKIVMMDKALGAISKAKNADVVAFTASRFDEFPDYWLTDTAFSSPRKVTDANPQQAEFVWGKAENIKYINGDGKVLTAMLIKPDNFDPAKKYPMMVYIYEELSQGLHGYRAPNVGTSINITRYVSNGYVVLQPDISYETGYPGPSAMKCVIPAINTVVAQGYIDPKRIGIQGHSWGGYQITYMITQTNIFAAVEAGASVSNMISAYGGIRWGSGMVRQFQYEKTQSRIGETLWDAPLQFIENSPIFWVERIHTPYLTIHNDGDDAVPWYQGIEFNMAMRRLGKEAYMFNYNGQPHGLNNRDYMKHWTVHMDEFFDHYLLGKPRPEWMDKGYSYLERGTRDVSGMFKRIVPPPPATKGGGNPEP